MLNTHTRCEFIGLCYANVLQLQNAVKNANYYTKICGYYWLGWDYRSLISFTAMHACGFTAEALCSSPHAICFGILHNEIVLNA